MRSFGTEEGRSRRPPASITRGRESFGTKERKERKKKATAKNHNSKKDGILDDALL
jgi:hypothetical protein